MDVYDICGYTAEVVGSGFIPQVYKSYKTKNMDDTPKGMAIYILDRSYWYNLQCS